LLLPQHVFWQLSSKNVLSLTVKGFLTHFPALSKAQLISPPFAAQTPPRYKQLSRRFAVITPKLLWTRTQAPARALARPSVSHDSLIIRDTSILGLSGDCVAIASSSGSSTASGSVSASASGLGSASGTGAPYPVVYISTYYDTVCSCTKTAAIR